METKKYLVYDCEGLFHIAKLKKENNIYFKENELGLWENIDNIYYPIQVFEISDEELNYIECLIEKRNKINDQACIWQRRFNETEQKIMEKCNKIKEIYDGKSN